MARSVVSTDFFSEVFHGVHNLPLKGFALAAGIGLINLVTDLLFRHLGGHYSTPEYAAFAAYLIVWLAGIYCIAMMLSDTMITWMGGLRFLSTMIVSIGFPIGLLFAGLWIMRGNSGRGAGSIVLIAVLVILFFAIPLLSGWPTGQAISRRFISPLRMLKATKGHRWGLFTASYASTAINKIVPATDTAKSTGQAILLATGNGAVSCASLVLLASIAATAWKFAVRQDPHIAEADDHSEG